MTDAEKLLELAAIVDDWRMGDVPTAGAMLRIERVLADEAPAVYRRPLGGDAA